ncbi:MAG: acyltransferase family protein [Oscillospiraceae bacterium]|nr:acyltransferase family protein [Oscillospiraceae bacterium]
MSYNGAWWFVFTYLVFVVTSPLVLRLSEKCNSAVIIFIFILVYLAAYAVRFDVLEKIGISIQAKGLFVRQIPLWGTTIFPYAAGVIFAKEKLYSKIHAFMHKHFNVPLVSLFAGLAVILCGVGHAIIRSAIVAPFTGIVSLCCFNLIYKPMLVKKMFLFLGRHSTNIWLTHMFFYNVLFKNLAYIAKYPLLVFLFMMFLTIASSLLINLVYNPAVKLYDRLIRKTLLKGEAFI